MREHIADIDNVPLLVPLFADSTPSSVVEMIGILQENGEVVCCIGSALRYDNTAAFAQADIAFAMEPQLQGCSHSVKKHGARRPSSNMISEAIAAANVAAHVHCFNVIDHSLISPQS